MRDVAFGQYFPGDSIIHRLDPRMKIVLLIANIVLLFCTFGFVSLGLMTAFIIAIILISGVPVKMYIKSLKVLLVIIIFTSVLNIFYGDGPALVQFYFLKITMSGISRAIYVTIRIVLLMLISSCLTFTTSPTDLTDGLERLMKPLTVFKIKVHEIAMMMSIALRFIPTLLDESDKIMSAQKARGADMESGNVFDKIKALFPVLIPLFISSIRRAVDLAMAMECRCYQGGQGRTRMKILHMERRDILSMLATVFVLAGVVLCNIFLQVTI